MKMDDTPIGMPFQYIGRNQHIFINNGDGTYAPPGTLARWPGCEKNVILVPTHLRPFSFLGIENNELPFLYHIVYNEKRSQYTDGDRALVLHEFAKRGIQLPPDFDNPPLLQFTPPNLDNENAQPRDLTELANTLISLAAYCNMRADAITLMRQRGAAQLSTNDAARLDMQHDRLPEWAQWRKNVGIR